MSFFAGFMTATAFWLFMIIILIAIGLAKPKKGITREQLKKKAKIIHGRWTGKVH